MRTIDEVRADAKTIRECIDAAPDVVAEFCTVSGISPTRLGYEAVGNPNLMRHLKERRPQKLPTIQKVMRYIENWPA